MKELPVQFQSMEHLGRPFLDRFGSRKIAILRDDASPESRAVLVSPASLLTGELMNEILSLTGGLPFVALAPERVSNFALSPMSRPRARPGIPPGEMQLLESVEAREGVTTGISTADRALTIRILGEEIPAPRKLVKPGHIFPVEVRDGGVLVKNSLPEGALDLVRLTNFSPAALFLDLLDSAGNYLKSSAQDQISLQLSIPLLSLSEITRYRLKTEELVVRLAQAKLPTTHAGELVSYIYKSKIHSGEHLALVKGEIAGDTPVLTRVQPEFTFADVFGGGARQTRSQLRRSLKAIGDRGCGVLVYLRRARSGQLAEQISGGAAVPTVNAALMREYGLGAQILRDLGVRKIELLTTSTKKLVALESFGIEIVSQRAVPE